MSFTIYFSKKQIIYILCLPWQEALPFGCCLVAAEMVLLRRRKHCRFLYFCVFNGFDAPRKISSLGQCMQFDGYLKRHRAEFVGERDVAMFDP